MHVQIHSGSSVRTTDVWQARMTEIVEASLERFADRLTGVEVFMSDENSREKSGGDDKRCRMEARIRGFEPVVVTTHADDFDTAVEDAAGKLGRALDHRFGRIADKHAQVSQSGDEPLGALRGELPERDA
ncbi:MAG: HPF/RaiA family ribosome-associated protein [Pirellulales bacterium]